MWHACTRLDRHAFGITLKLLMFHCLCSSPGIEAFVELTTKSRPVDMMDQTICLIPEVETERAQAIIIEHERIPLQRHAMGRHGDTPESSGSLQHEGHPVRRASLVCIIRACCSKVVTHAQASGMLPRIYAAPLLLDQVMIDEGLANMGDTRRLKRAMHKLVTGNAFFGSICNSTVPAEGRHVNMMCGMQVNPLHW